MKSIALILGFILPMLHSIETGNRTYVTIPEGFYHIGEQDHPHNDLRMVQVKEFHISPYEVTNAQFSEFVKATGYVTTAERLKNAQTFRLGLDEFEWLDDSSAYWRFPFGTSNEGIEDKMDHPVTCISFMDALAYCEWSKERLPTLVEWEVASRANSTDRFFWGKDMSFMNKYANTWVNRDHKQVTVTDEYLFTAPVGSYEPNSWGLYDMYGNVFEFCADKIPHLESKKDLICARGGSWWCSRLACSYFNSVDIGRVHRMASFSNHGFRTVKREAGS